jgi:hypothetical protein
MSDTNTPLKKVADIDVPCDVKLAPWRLEIAKNGEYALVASLGNDVYGRPYAVPWRPEKELDETTWASFVRGLVNLLGDALIENQKLKELCACNRTAPTGGKFMSNQEKRPPIDLMDALKRGLQQARSVPADVGISDTELLDWLEANGSVGSWTCRRSTTGRGLRLHEGTWGLDEHSGAFTALTIRGAIAGLMRQAAEREAEATSEFSQDGGA